LEGDTIVVDVKVGVDGITVLLQLCEWHAVEAIKRRLIHTGYSKESREQILEYVYQWVKAPDIERLEIARKILLRNVLAREREYIQNYYQPKEVQFCRAYTNTYINLGVYSTQRNESYHVVVKKNLNKNLTISAAVEALVTKTSELAETYNERINKDRMSLPTLMDAKAFATVKSQLTHYAISLVNAEYMQAKVLQDEIEHGESDFTVVNEAIGCTLGCQLPARYRLPCKHWMLPFYVEDRPLPLSLFHSRWLLDGPPFVQNWRMSGSPLPPQVSLASSRDSSPDTSRPSSPGPSYPALRYEKNGEQLIIDAATKAVAKLKTLAPGQKETYASGFNQLVSTLDTRQDEITSSRRALPAQLPNALPRPEVLFPKNRRRGYTGREAAEDNEKSARRVAKEKERQAESERAENERWNTEIRQEHINRHCAARAAREDALASVASASLAREVIEISSDDSDETASLYEEMAAEVKAEALEDEFDISGLVETGSPLLLSRDPSETPAENARVENTEAENAEVSSESDEEESDEDLPNISQLADLTGERPICKKRQRKDYTKILPPSSVSLRSSRRPTKKADSQNARDEAAKEAKEERKKAREAKANRIGTGRTKRQEALAKSTQLMDEIVADTGIELPFRGSQ